jgi:hypothetical protein
MIPNVNDDDVMYYNGYTPDGRYGKIGPPWYRYSQINGYRSWEYSKPPMDIKPFQISEGYKPLWTNCNCYPKFIKLGRFGAWEKQILTHHVYGGTFSALQRMLRSD